MRLAAVVLLALIALPAQAQHTLRLHPTRWRLTFERVTMVEEAPLGLVGGHYDLLAPIPPLSPVFLGLGGYGAVSGIRGGFFVLGVTAGVRAQPHPNFGFELGGFAGGGGGGAAAQGSGLMLRPHAALEATWQRASVRLELAWVAFPTGSIQSTHLAAGITLPDELHLLGPAVEAEPAVLEAGPRIRIAAAAATYLPSADSVRRSRGPHEGPMFLAGTRLDRFIGEHLFIPLVANGALAGGVGGYMDVFSGLGVSLPLSKHFGLEVIGLAGAGGGGDVNTGGGLLLHPTAAAWVRLGDAFLQLSGGHLFSPQGRFGGWTGALHVGLQSDRVDVSATPGETVGLEEAAAIEVDRWTVALAHKSYFPSIDRENVQLLGAGIDRPLTEWLALTGRGYAAYLGGAGGYAEGLLGMQLRATPLRFAPNHEVRLDLQVGAAGGGGLQVASGLIAQATAQYRLRLARQFALSIGAGRMIALRGPFAATVVQAELEWRLRFPVIDPPQGGGR